MKLRDAENPAWAIGCVARLFHALKVFFLRATNTRNPSSARPANSGNWLVREHVTPRYPSRCRATQMGWRIGQYVVHAKFGQGVIVDAKGRGRMRVFRSTSVARA
ncbi:MAG TPA: hypothetical protein VMV87_09100 [Burkholderiales bacterium]|nr:hypothetical protein [Burkholderiales bacterium]